VSRDGAPQVVTFPKSARVRSSREFQRVYNAKVRISAGPLVVYGRPNGGTMTRLGLSVPKRSGNAVRRNAIKRRLREAFRHARAGLPPGYDVVVNVKPHDMMTSTAYRELLEHACVRLHRQWSRP